MAFRRWSTIWRQRAASPIAASASPAICARDARISRTAAVARCVDLRRDGSDGHARGVDAQACIGVLFLGDDCPAVVFRPAHGRHAALHVEPPQKTSDCVKTVYGAMDP